ncbi:MAG: hypothetical protein ACRC0L_08965, partial [Angustibacter sp.]
RVDGVIDYDQDTGRVSDYTDIHGGLWRVGNPSVTGSATDLRRSVRVVDPRGFPMLYEYDGLTGRLVRTGLPTGSTPPAGSGSGDPLAGLALRSYEYDVNGFISGIVNEVGVRVTMKNDTLGNVLQKTICRTPTQCFSTYFTYPALVAGSTDPRQTMPVSQRDARASGPTDPFYTTYFQYNILGDVTSQTSLDRTLVTHTHTIGGEVAVGGGFMPPGLLKQTTNERRQTTTYQYNAAGDLMEVTEPTGVRTTFTYDEIGRRLGQTQFSDAFPAGVTTKTTYDALSRVVSQSGPATRDAVTKAAHQLKTTQSYDADGRVIRTVSSDDLAGGPTRTTTMEYDASGRLMQMTDPEGSEVSMGYDVSGNRTSMVDANG